MTKQEAYEKIRAWLTRPGARHAYDAEWTNDRGEKQGLCRYETEIDGELQRCAVGCLLSEQDLARSMASFEGSVYGLFENYGVPVYLMGIGNRDADPLQGILTFLGRFQNVHDAEDSWDPITGTFLGVDRLDTIALDYGLTVVE